MAFPEKRKKWLIFGVCVKIVLVGGNDKWMGVVIFFIMFSS